MIGITNRQVINDFREVVADQMYISDSSGWSHRLVFHHLRNTRARILYEKKKSKNQKLSQHIFQTIPCIPLTTIDTTECPCAPALGCLFLKTTLPIPKPIGTLTSVTTVDIQGSTQYTYVDWDKFKYKLDSRFEFVSKKPYYTLKNIDSQTYLYVYNDKHKKLVSITGVFEDALEIQQYPDCGGNINGCPSPLEEPFLIDADLLPLLFDLTFKMLVSLKRSSGADLTEDAIDTNPSQNSAPRQRG